MQIKLSRGDVWDAYVPFQQGPFTFGQLTGKTRPVIIVGWTGQVKDGNILVVPVTSFNGNPAGKVFEGDIKIADTAKAGLDENKESYILARRVTTINPRSIRKPAKRGRITKEEFDMIIIEIAKLLNPSKDSFTFTKKN